TTLRVALERQLALAVPELLDRNAHLVRDREQQVRRRISLEGEVTAAGHEVLSSDEHERQVRVIVRVALAQPRTVQQQGVVEQRAVAIRRVPQLLEIRRE